MTSLPEFLLARIAEDEAVAVRSCHQAHPGADVYHADGHPDRKRLAECEAKRRMLALLDEVNEQGIPRLTIYTRDLLPRLLALPYADHPDYRQEWKP